MNYLDQLSKERKELQDKDFLPTWYTTAGWQLLKDKYLWADTPREQYEHIARTLAKHTDDEEKWYDKFFQLMWRGWLSPSTPVLANTGTDRGLPVSCSGSYVADSIDGFYSARRETALLTKYGFGTSAYLGDIRPRGSNISAGGKASGILPVLKGFVQDSRDVSQAGIRRGSWAGYVPIDHADFDEVVNFLEKEPDDVNIGWNISDEFVTKLSDGDSDARRRFSRALKAKMVTGKGYFWFPDKANRKLPAYYPIKHYAAQLCNEILLPSDEEHTYTCVLSSMNVALYDEWKDTDAIFTATVFLDCVASEFIERAKGIAGLEKAVRFTEKARSLGLGIAGYHTYLQSKRWSFGSLDTVYFNQQLFEKLDTESYRASIWMGEQWGCPEWVTNTKATSHKFKQLDDGTYTVPAVRNCSRLAVAPTKSTALIMGGISEGINPDPAYVYTQTTAGGEVQRVAPELLKVMKERKVYNKETLQGITDAFGSVQHVDWLTDEEKLVFRTAFEIDQHVLVRLASQRAKFLDQWQSVNLFFSAKETPKYIAEVHKTAFEDENILGLYYIYSAALIAGSKDRDECEACAS